MVIVEVVVVVVVKNGIRSKETWLWRGRGRGGGCMLEEFSGERVVTVDGGIGGNQWRGRH